MINCHDLLINSDDKPWMFYEWNNNDNYCKLKNVYVIKLSNSEMKNIITYRIKIDTKSLINKRWVLFLSSYDAVVIKFSIDGKEIMRSRLDLKSERDVIDSYSCLKEHKLEYECLDRIPLNKETRLFIEDKRTIESELERIIRYNIVDEAKYLYYEWFGKLENDFDKMVKEMYAGLVDRNYSVIHHIGKLVKIFSK